MADIGNFRVRFATKPNEYLDIVDAKAAMLKHAFSRAEPWRTDRAFRRYESFRRKQRVCR
ncbi:unnamed protein product [Arabis nemorensis]|uniref:Uncharacterized protein n=1 Tax=Arabis nemorensis TaxID=586526 RepID=A0A565BN15_9BRAS|nr:unnamed protein product [Arabis nemorensis]